MFRACAKFMCTQMEDCLFASELEPLPSIGTIAEGVDKDKTIHTYIDDYLAQTKPLCENCWAFNICPMCYAACFDKGGVNIKKKSFACQNCRTHTYLMLGTFCTLMEERPDALEVLDRSVLL